MLVAPSPAAAHSDDDCDEREPQQQQHRAAAAARGVDSRALSQQQQAEDAFLAFSDGDEEPPPPAAGAECISAAELQSDDDHNPLFSKAAAHQAAVARSRAPPGEPHTPRSPLRSARAPQRRASHPPVTQHTHCAGCALQAERRVRRVPAPAVQRR
jgi:hypothetical protein